MVTAQQLQLASNLSTQIGETNEHLRQVIQAAQDAKVAGVPLDQTVKDALQTEYVNTKATLGSLVQQLP